MKTPPDGIKTKYLLRIGVALLFVFLFIDTNFNAIVYCLVWLQLGIVYIMIDLVIDRYFEK